MPKKITFSLSNVNKALREVKRIQRKLDDNTIVKKLCERGVEIAKENVPVLQGIIRDSISYRVYRGKGTIYVGAEEAVYVEFGSGIPGSRFPHPSVVVTYNRAGRELGEKWFFKDERRGIQGMVEGMPARPFMYLTALQLQNEATDIVAEVLRE